MKYRELPVKPKQIHPSKLAWLLDKPDVICGSVGWNEVEGLPPHWLSVDIMNNGVFQVWIVVPESGPEHTAWWNANVEAIEENQRRHGINDPLNPMPRIKPLSGNN